MSKIIFFSIPAHGHTNPTIPVVNELVQQGHQVWYYSFYEFQEKIEHTGAKFIACDEYLPPINERELERKAGKDFASLIEMVVDTTISMEKRVLKELTELKPDCIVSDSLCFWGRLFAEKLNIPYVCSTTTFAFNKYIEKRMKRSFMEMTRMVFGIPRIHKKMKKLKDHGYEVNFQSLIQNNLETDTIVYTTRKFQPMEDTFPRNYVFVGPSLFDYEKSQAEKKSSKVIYISLGTVLNKRLDFYQNCMKAFSETQYEVIMSVGEKIDVKSLGGIPDNFTVKNRVDQLSVLKKADVFITHGGMNSVNESLYYGVPMVVYPFHSEQKLVADRIVELQVGIQLKRNRLNDLQKTIKTVLSDSKYSVNAKSFSNDFKSSGGPKEAVRVIMKKIQTPL
ncbi:macrolide family glycosyltransferase [Metabacillus sp. HB246100]